MRNGERRAGTARAASTARYQRESGQEVRRRGKEVCVCEGGVTEVVNSRTLSVWEQENGEGQKYRRVKSPGEGKFSGGSIWAKCQLMCLY